MDAFGRVRGQGGGGGMPKLSEVVVGGYGEGLLMSKETVLCWSSVHEDKVYLTPALESTGHQGGEGGAECSNPLQPRPPQKVRFLSQQTISGRR